MDSPVCVASAARNRQRAFHDSMMVVVVMMMNDGGGENLVKWGSKHWCVRFQAGDEISGQVRSGSPTLSREKDLHKEVWEPAPFMSEVRLTMKYHQRLRRWSCFQCGSLSFLGLKIKKKKLLSDFTNDDMTKHT